MIDPRYPHTTPHVDEYRTLHVYALGDEVVIDWPGPEGNGNGGERYLLNVDTAKSLCKSILRTVQRIQQ